MPSTHTSSVTRAVCVSVLALLSLGIANAEGLLDLNGSPANPLKESHGLPLVFVFVRTDCPISNRYAPEIQRLEQKYSAQAHFWLIYPGQSQTVAAIRKHLAEFAYHAPALRDTALDLVRLSDVKVTPEAAVFNPSGQLVYHGRIDNRYQDFGRARALATTHELDDAISAAIDGKVPAVAAAPAVGCSLADLASLPLR